jgi:hypothetical protein
MNPTHYGHGVSHVKRALSDELRRRWPGVLRTGFEGRSVLPRQAQVHLAVHFIAVAPLVIA